MKNTRTHPVAPVRLELWKAAYAQGKASALADQIVRGREIPLLLRAVLGLR